MVDKPIYKKHLTPEQYEICWNRGTEPPFSGQYHDCKDKGIYKCICCGNKPIHLQHQIQFWHGLAQLLDDSK
jgi:peptide methionine sulfoxide reductase MsrB